MPDEPGEDVISQFYALMSDLGEIESEFEPLNHRREELRTQIGIMVATHGSLRIPSASATITNPSVTRRVNLERLTEIIAVLRADGFENIASMVESSIETSERSGSLRITWTRR